VEVQINLLAVALATVAGMLVSASWYSERAFGAEWCKLTKLKGKALKIESTEGALIVFVASLITAYVLAHITYLAHAFFGNSYIKDALTTAFWVWLGIAGVRMIAHDTFQCRPVKLTLINASHELVTLLIMAVIIGIVQP
jgi:hypothetical protein